MAKSNFSVVENGKSTWLADLKNPPAVEKSNPLIADNVEDTLTSVAALLAYYQWMALNPEAGDPPKDEDNNADYGRYIAFHLMIDTARDAILKQGRQLTASRHAIGTTR